MESQINTFIQWNDRVSYFNTLYKSYCLSLSVTGGSRITNCRKDIVKWMELEIHDKYYALFLGLNWTVKNLVSSDGYQDKWI